ncbi:MAG: TrkA family potassium uptake protein [Desulfobacteraceae bacterium]|nr:MAG: TrkA family potassium uptake protein [Desulfobacteraceae bacterium]
MKVIIVGEGGTLYFLSRSFLAKGHRVALINRRKEECVELARKLKATIICGDGSDPGILEEAGAMGADLVLAVTPNDQDNLVISQVASLQYGVSRVLALANDPDNKEAFEQLGVHAFSTTLIISSLIEQRASLDQITNLLPIEEGLVNITEVVLDADSPVNGKTLEEIKLGEDGLVAVVIRGSQTIVPHGSTRLMERDRVVLVTLPETHAPVVRTFTGEAK